jgi:hypothetical protein
LTRKFRGKLSTVIDQIEHGHHVYSKKRVPQTVREVLHFPVQRTMFQQPERLRLDRSGSFAGGWEKLQVITDRFASCQAQWLTVHVDFPLLQHPALPITIGSVRYPGIKIHDTRIIRLLEVLLHATATPAVGRPSRFTKPSTPPSASTRHHTT